MYTGEASTDFDAVNASSDTVEFTVEDGDKGNSAIAYADTDITDTSLNTTNLSAGDLSITDGSSVTVDTDNPLVADTITQNSHPDTIQVTITEANDLFANDLSANSKINDGDDSLGEWTIASDPDNVLQSITVPTDLSGGGVVDIVLSDANAGTFDPVEIEFYQLHDNPGNRLENDTTAANTYLTITDDGNTWSAAWSNN